MERRYTARSGLITHHLTEEYRLAAALLGAWVFNILFNPVQELLCKWGFDTYSYVLHTSNVFKIIGHDHHLVERKRLS